MNDRKYEIKRRAGEPLPEGEMMDGVVEIVMRAIKQAAETSGRTEEEIYQTLLEEKPAKREVNVENLGSEIEHKTAQLREYQDMSSSDLTPEDWAERERLSSELRDLTRKQDRAAQAPASAARKEARTEALAELEVVTDRLSEIQAMHGPLTEEVKKERAALNAKLPDLNRRAYTHEQRKRGT